MRHDAECSILDACEILEDFIPTHRRESDMLSRECWLNRGGFSPDEFSGGRHISREYGKIMEDLVPVSFPEENV